MSDDGLTDRGVVRALDLAEGYLEDAENVVWEASSQAESAETAADLETLTREIWRVEHALADLRNELESESGTEPETNEKEAQTTDA